MNLTCDQVSNMAQLQKRGRLQPITPYVSYFDEYADIEIFEAVRLLHRAFSQEYNLFIDRIITSVTDSNSIFKRLRDEKKVVSISKLPSFKKMPVKTKLLKERECYSNAMRLTLYGVADKMITGTATLPIYDDYGELIIHTFMHAVAEKDGMILDYNYGIAMDKKEYLRLFAFAPIDEIDHQELVTQFYVSEQYKDRLEKMPNCTTMHFVMANSDFCKKVFDYDRICDQYEKDKSDERKV